MQSGFHIFNLKNIKKLAISIALPLLIGILSSLLGGTQQEAYSSFAKPPLSPPSWLFPVVWTILYILMGISAYLVSKTDADDDAKKSAFVFYGLQIIFNFFWSIWFFRFSLYGFSFLWLIALLILVVITAVKFYDINAVAGWLYIPYIAWMSFAAYLNYMIWMLN